MLDFYMHFDPAMRMLYHKIGRERGKVITKVEFLIQNLKVVYKMGNSVTKLELRLTFDPFAPNYLVILQILTFFMLILHKGGL